MRRSIIMSVIAVLTLISISTSAATDNRAFRSFGYMLGDILEQNILLVVDGVPVEIQKFPEQNRKGRWLQLISTSVNDDKDGQHWLQLRYQIINAPTEPLTAALPALSLVTTSGKTIEIAPLPFGLIPMTLAIKSRNNVLPVMQADHQPQKPDGASIQNQMIKTAMALVVTLLAWSGWWRWRQFKDATRLPFAKAMHHLRKLRAKQGKLLDENPPAWSILHAAFNETAGHTLSSQSLASFLQQQSWLQPFESHIITFYRISDARFFKPDAKVDYFALFDLCKSLYVAEKKQAIAVNLTTAEGAR